MISKETLLRRQLEIINADLDATSRNNNPNYKPNNKKRLLPTRNHLSAEEKPKSKVNVEYTEHLKIYNQIIAYYNVLGLFFGIDVRYDWKMTHHFNFWTTNLCLLVGNIYVPYNLYYHIGNGDYIRTLEPLALCGLLFTVNSYFGQTGQERFRTLTTAYYRGAMGILLMYDVTSLESFNNLSYWLRNIQENAAPDVVKVLAGNKCECLPAQRMVEKERGDRIAENFDMPFFEVSCKNNINIEESFLTLARQIREQREHRGENFDNDGTQEKKSGTGSGTGLGPFTLGSSPDSNRCSC